MVQAVGYLAVTAPISMFGGFFLAAVDTLLREKLRLPELTIRRIMVLCQSFGTATALLLFGLARTPAGAAAVCRTLQYVCSTISFFVYAYGTILFMLNHTKIIHNKIYGNIMDLFRLYLLTHFVLAEENPWPNFCLACAYPRDPRVLAGAMPEGGCHTLLFARRGGELLRGGWFEHGRPEGSREYSSEYPWLAHSNRECSSGLSPTDLAWAHLFDCFAYYTSWTYIHTHTHTRARTHRERVTIHVW